MITMSSMKKGRVAEDRDYSSCQCSTHLFHAKTTILKERAQRAILPLGIQVEVEDDDVWSADIFTKVIYNCYDKTGLALH